MAHLPFSGVITAIATPFQKNGEIDEPGFQKLVRMQKAAGIHGIVVAGTTGESPVLTEAEKERLVTLALQECADEFHVYVGTGSNDTAASVQASTKYSAHGKVSAKVGEMTVHPDGVMAVVPYYNKPNQTGLYEHFKKIAESIPGTPFCIYNVPGRTGAVLAPSTFVKLAKTFSNIVAIKEAAGDVRVITELRRGLDELGLSRKVHILSGDDPTYAPALLCGADGVISVTTHLIPGAMLGMLKAAKAKDFEKLQKLHLAAYPINAGLFCAPNPIPLKFALAHLGVCENNLRLPMTELEAKEIEIVKNAMSECEKAGISLLK